MLFDRIVVPILVYIATIWGFKQFEQIELVRYNFCKKVLAVKSTTPIAAVMKKAGRYSLYSVFYKVYKYWKKLLRMTSDIYPKACYNLIYEMDYNDRITWVTKAKHLIYMYGFSFVYLSQNEGNEKIVLYKFKQRLTDRYQHNWIIAKD